MREWKILVKFQEFRLFPNRVTLYFLEYTANIDDSGVDAVLMVLHTIFRVI